MAYYDALTAKWATLTGSTADRLAAINALTVDGPAQPLVPVAQIMTYLRSNGLWLPIKAAAAAAATSQGAAAAVDYNQDARTTTIDVSLPIVQGMLADLVAHSLLSQPQSAAIVAMQATTIPWWQSAGYTSPIGEADLDMAGLS